MNTMTKAVRPIRFHKLHIDSKFRIFAEPERGIRLSKDTATYVKKAESWSHEVGDEAHCIILLPEDLVVPLSRGA